MTLLGYAITAGASIIVALVGWLVARGNRSQTPYEALARRVVELEDRDRAKADQLAEQARLLADLRDESSHDRQRIAHLDRDVAVLAAELWQVHVWDGTPPPPVVGTTALEIIRRRRPVPHDDADEGTI